MINFIFLKMLFPILYTSTTLFNGMFVSVFLLASYFLFYYALNYPNNIVKKKIPDYYFVYKILVLSFIVSLFNFILSYIYPQMDLLVTGLLLCNLLLLEKDSKDIRYLLVSAAILIGYSFFREIIGGGGLTFFQMGDMVYKFDITGLPFEFANYPFFNYIMFALLNIGFVKYTQAKGLDLED